ncbi:MAG: hypothetical protein LBB36_05015 [Fibromonadaceae bacterium]|jgi:hypothetical protein|nr:hypothetical protein [Fibromonadaceae bacterium]
MLTDTVLKRKGLDMNEPFDYTEWQKDLYGDMPLDEFYKKVKAARVSA